MYSKKLSTILCAIGLIVIASAFTTSQEVYADVDKKFEGMCAICGNKSGVYVWWTDEFGNQKTSFFPNDGSKSTDSIPGHRTFLIDPNGDNDGEYGDDSPSPIDINLRPIGSDLLLESNQLVESDIIDLSTGATVKKVTVEGREIIPVGNLERGKRYSILSTNSVGEKNGKMFILNNDNTIDISE